MNERLIIKELIKAEKINELTDKGIPPWKAILFFLEKFNTGNYYGTIAIKINGAMVHNPKELEITHKLESRYENVS